MNKTVPHKRKKEYESEEKENEEKNDIEKVKKFIFRKQHLEITKEVTFRNNTIQNNTPTVINYKNHKFNINTRRFYEQYECTWKCCYFRREKDKPKNEKYFCNAGIKGIRDVIDTNIFKYYLLESHSKICENLNQTNSKTNGSDKFETVDNDENNEDECVNEKKIYIN